MADPDLKETIDPSKDWDRVISTYKRINLLALSLAVIALALTLILPGILPPRSGTVIARVDRYFTPVGVTLTSYPQCMHVLDAEVTLEVPSAGTIVVATTGRIALNHTFGTIDVVSFFTGNSSSTCAYPFAWIEEIPSTWPSHAYLDRTYSFQTTFTVASKGSYKFYLNGHMWDGGDPADTILTASILAVFYPS